MKRNTHFTGLVLLMSALQAAQVCSGQSTFFFRNRAIHQSGILDAPVFDAAGNRLLGSNYVAVLYGGPTPDSLTPARYLFNSEVIAPTPFTYVSGFGEVGYFNEPATVVILGVGGNEYAWLQVKAWDLRLGSSYDHVFSLGMGGYGESNLFYAQAGNEAASIPPGFLIGLESFSLLQVVPEPSGSLLMVLGGVTLLAVRYGRRK